jgi:AcrR family transcriptional regulator
MSRQSRYREKGAPKSRRPARLDITTTDTRERIRAAARRLFAEHGYNGTSVRDIVAAADVNLGAVTYYFETKALLYTSVLGMVVLPLAHRIEGIAKIDASPLERIDRVVREFLDHIRINPDMPALMMRELSSGETPSGPIVQLISRVLPAVSGVIAEGQRIGDIRAGDPALLTFSVIAQPIHLYLARGALAAVMGHDVNDPAVLERIVTHVTLTVRRALEAR